MKWLDCLWGIYSVWHQNARIYVKSWFVNAFAPMTEPVLYLLAFGFGLSPIIGSVHYLDRPYPYLRFIAPGMIAIGVLFQSFFEGAYGTFVRVKFMRNWHAMLTAPLTYSDLVIGDWLWAATKGTFSGIITGLVAAAFGVYPLPALLFSLPLIILGALLFAAFGLCSAGAVNNIDQMNVPVFLFLTPMFLLCGTYFPRDGLPPLINAAVSLLPLSALLDLLRWPLGLPEGWTWSVLWLFAWMTGLFGAAYWLLKKTALCHGVGSSHERK